MNINATLLGQMITFAIFVVFTMKFVWPPMMRALEERKKKIADGLAAAERGVRELEVAKHKSAEMLRDAKIQAASIVDKANKRASQIIDESKQKARDEGERLLVLAKEDIEKEVLTARRVLKEQASNIIVAGTEKLIEKEVDAAANSEIIDKVIREL